jgi:hypothetical protein
VFNKTKIAMCISIFIGATSAGFAKSPIAMEPYGTSAEQWQCLSDMEASLHGRSVLGSRDTSAYIQDRGNLDSMGLTEEDVMVGRCMKKFFHRYLRSHGEQQRRF